MKVLMIDPVPPALLHALGAHMPEGLALEGVADPSPGAFAAAAFEAEVFLAIHRRLGAAEFALAPRLRFVQRLGAGFDNIDLGAARAAGVVVATAPGANAEAVAEHTVMLMLAVLKRLIPTVEATRRGEWPEVAVLGARVGDLQDATVGLVGAGHIGLAVARRLRPFGCRLLYTGRRRLEPGAESAAGLAWASLDDLLAASDVLSLHLPLTPGTRGLLGREAIGRMKPGAIVINTARGEVVDEKALFEALSEGRLGGAGLDVLAAEGEGIHPLASLPTVVVTPHYAGASRGAQMRILRMAAENLARYAAGERPQHVMTEPDPGRPG